MGLTAQLTLSTGPGHHFVLLAQLQPAYPSLLPPEVQLLAPNLPEDVLGWAASQLQQLFIPGAVSLQAALCSC